MIIIDNATVSEVATFDEPTTSQDGSAITDLAYTVVEYSIGGAAPVVGPHIPASKPTGGGHITTTVIIPAPAGAKTTFSFDVFAVDLTGNKGTATASVQSVIDRVGPSAPTNFTIG